MQHTYFAAGAKILAETAMRCRFNFVREGHSAIYEGSPGDTYADALLSLCIVPDTVLIFHAGKSLPEDAPIGEDEVDIVTTSSRG
jgi:hypothetical protein